MKDVPRLSGRNRVTTCRRIGSRPDVIDRKEGGRPLRSAGTAPVIDKFAKCNAILIAFSSQEEHKRLSSVCLETGHRCYFSAKTAGTAQRTLARRAGATLQKARRPWSFRHLRGVWEPMAAVPAGPRAADARWNSGAPPDSRPGNGGAAKSDRGIRPGDDCRNLATTAFLFNFLVRPPRPPIPGMNFLLFSAVNGYPAGGDISRWSHRDGSTRRRPQGSAAALAPAPSRGGGHRRIVSTAFSIRSRR